MDAELYKEYLQDARKGDHISRLMGMEEWKAVEDLVQDFIREYDTVRGAKTDKEWLVRGAKVQVLEDLLGSFTYLKEKSGFALEKLQEESDPETPEA